MKVRFTECSDEQARWGSGSDPREFLKLGEIYTVVDEEEHSWHTLYYLEGFEEGFNSVCFEELTKWELDKETID